MEKWTSKGRACKQKSLFVDYLTTPEMERKKQHTDSNSMLFPSFTLMLWGGWGGGDSLTGTILALGWLTG